MMDEFRIEQFIGPRWREVEEYAARLSMTFEDAVIELINKGLSHVDPG